MQPCITVLQYCVGSGIRVEVLVKVGYITVAISSVYYKVSPPFMKLMSY